MKQKVVTAMISAVFVMSTGVSAVSNAAALPAVTAGIAAPTQLHPMLQSVQAKVNKTSTRRQHSVFKPEKGLSGEYNYIVRFSEAPLATYRGGVAGLKATSPEMVRDLRNSKSPRLPKLNAKSADSRAYLAYLEQRQAAMEQKIDRKLKRVPAIMHRYKAALNAVTMKMTQDEAIKLSTMQGIVHIQRDYASKPETDRGPTFIGADTLWDGSTVGLATQGEGVIVGIIDSGINGDHPSFADIGDDGYDHTNPNGSGNYLGECFATPDLVCNDKLIGRYLFTDAQPGAATSSEDVDGHGSHVASTVAGNVLMDVPVFDAEGNDSGFTIDRISGVAPHANIIAYRVCAPSCFSSDIVNAIDQAILDGVDVLNHSIGSQPGSPWEDSKSMAFLNARAAGISVANSAGNDGPAAETVEGATNAPWMAAVAALSHDRDIPLKNLSNLSGGDTTPPTDIQGRAITVGYGPAAIVYAGNYTNGDVDPEQCLTPFPAGTWSSGEIVVCDRGAIARVDKCINVRDGGAAGCVLANVDGGATNLADDPHVIPAIHIDAVAGNALKTWLSSGTGHMATIDASGAWGSDPAKGDIMADFSSRGPYPGFDFLSPNIAAPGLAIYAAFSSPEEYAFLQGTSMASPHVAGAMALLKQATSWSDAEILSALMSTGETNVVKEDGVTPADNFDFGAGRVQLEQAAIAGLILDESAANFAAADPALGGDPRTLNVASMLDDSCLASCSWQRTVKATTAGTWTASSTGDFNVTVDPAVFTLAEGESQTITVTADVTSSVSGTWSFAEVTLSPDTAGVPMTNMPVVVLPSSGIIPELIDIDAHRDAGSVLLSGLQSVAFSNLQIDVSGLTKTSNTDLLLLGDTDNTDSFDNLTDGVGHQIVTVPANSTRLVAFTRDADSQSPDVDLRVGQDLNGDGLPSADELVCTSATATAEEFCEVSNPAAGNWWVQVQNWQPSGTTEDLITLRTAAVSADTGTMTAEGPVSAGALEAWDLRVFWNDAMQEGDYYFGSIGLGSDPASPGDIGVIPVNLVRGADDVSFAVNSNTAAVGDTLTFTATIQPNLSEQDLNYSIEAAVPAGFSVVASSVSGGGTISGNSIIWDLNQPSLANSEGSYVQSTNLEDTSCLMPDFGQPNSGYIDLEGFGLLPDTSIAGDTVAFSAFSGQDLTFYGQPRTGVNFTDDGFAFFNSTQGSAPWTNTGIPDSNDPNDLLAILWKDFELVADSTAGSIRGVTLASAGTDITIIEYDDVEPYPAGSTTDRVDFEVYLKGSIDDTPGVPEIVFAYDNIVGDFSLTTIGVENETGTSGTQTAFNDAMLSDGLLVCYDFQGPSFDPVVLTFDVTVDAGSEGASLQTDLTNSIDNPGSSAVTLSETVTVAGEPAPDYSGRFVARVTDGTSHSAGINLPLIFVLRDGRTNTLDPNVLFLVTEVATGNVVSVIPGRPRNTPPAYFGLLRTAGFATGDYRITALVQGFGPVYNMNITLN